MLIRSRMGVSADGLVASWPWAGLSVYVLTSRPLPDGTAELVYAPG